MGPGRLAGLVNDGSGVLDPLGRNLIETAESTDSIDPFGEAIAGSAPDAAAGYRSEVNVDGLTYLRNRYYDPVSSQFLSTDPLGGVVGSSTSTNPYHFANNDPLTHSDPSGLQPNDGGVNPPPVASPEPPTAIIPAAAVQTGYTKIRRRPGYGSVRINLFISACSSRVPLIGPTFDGNCRSYDKNAAGPQSKVSLLMNFETGYATIFVNFTCVKNGRCYDALTLGINNPVEYVYPQPYAPPPGCTVSPAGTTTTSIPIVGAGMPCTDPIFNYQNLINFHDDDKTSAVQYKATNAAAQALGYDTPAIDGVAKLFFGTSDHAVGVCDIGDGYPSFEAYHHNHGHVAVLAQWPESSWGPVALTGYVGTRFACGGMG